MPAQYSGDDRQSRYERMLQGYLSGELRIVNAGLPRSQKTLALLLREEFPHVLCHDGSTQLIKRKELDYLASILDSGEQDALLLPMLIELGGDQSQATVLCAGEVERKVVSTILDMPLLKEPPASPTSHLAPASTSTPPASTTTPPAPTSTPPTSASTPPTSATPTTPLPPISFTELPFSTAERDTITIYRPQLALLRKRLKTTTQYLFPQENSAPGPSLTNSIE